MAIDPSQLGAPPQMMEPPPDMGAPAGPMPDAPPALDTEAAITAIAELLGIVVQDHQKKQAVLQGIAEQAIMAAMGGGAEMLNGPAGTQGTPMDDPAMLDDAALAGEAIGGDVGGDVPPEDLAA